MTRLLLACLIPVALAACGGMDHQPRYDSYERSSLFPDGKSMQAPPQGAVALDDPAWSAALENRPAMGFELLQRGRERYGIYCSPCHDASGHGRGTVPARGFPRPPSFHISRLRAGPSSHFVDVITRGHGVMYSYAARVAPADRWAIAAYIRALQISQNVPAAALSPDELAKLGEVAP
ncbi:MAG: c-type cytochrome [Hyphomicrobiaceae bacterium]|nr:c-type cytochrome [Hyphomicrobiaceae bacterium]